MKKIANVIACVFTAVSLYAFFTARTFPPGSNGALGPGFFPQVLAVLVIFLSVLELVGSRNAVIPENQRGKPQGMAVCGSRDCVHMDPQIYRV